jgi:hypothetical protein
MGPENWLGEAILLKNLFGDDNFGFLARYYVKND